MLTTLRVLSAAVLVTVFTTIVVAADAPAVKEVALDGPHGVKIRVRMEGPYTAETPLQVVCYFPYSAEAVQRMSGAPVELDRHLGGIIGSLRERGEFTGDEQETLLLTPPAHSIPAGKLLLIGLGPEEQLSADVLARVGRTALREAALSGAPRVAFAPLIRDQGNMKIPAGDVEVAILKAMLLAYDTQVRLQNEGLAPRYVLQEWIVEAGPTYFDETVVGTRKAIAEAEAAIAARPNGHYRTAR